jgi:hypothetical protein
MPPANVYINSPPSTVTNAVKPFCKRAGRTRKIEVEFTSLSGYNKSVFCDISEDINLWVFIALTDYPSATLFQIGWPPRTIQVVKRNQLVLDVGAGSHFRRGSHKNPHLTFANTGEKLLFL